MDTGGARCFREFGVCSTPLGGSDQLAYLHWGAILGAIARGPGFSEQSRPGTIVLEPSSAVFSLPMKPDARPAVHLAGVATLAVGLAGNSRTVSLMGSGGSLSATPWL